LNEYGKKLMAERSANNSKDDPEGLCLPMGTPRKDPYPWRIIHTPKLMVILYEGNIHSYRQIFLDGRPHDKRVEETWWGDSIGHWEGDTLVVDITAFNDKTELPGGFRHTESLHVIERFTRTADGIQYEATVEDPNVFVRPWKMVRTFQQRTDLEKVDEFVCENNHDYSKLFKQ